MTLNTEPYLQRKKLPHEIPPWVPQGARHYITINCRQRGANILCREQVAGSLMRSAEAYEIHRRWYLWLMLIMPDHIHLIATFDLNRGIRRIVSAWKSYQTKTHGIEWQSDFFEHRLRDEAEFIEKASYIHMNPVRKGLISTAEKWPYVIERNTLWTQNGSAGTPRPTMRHDKEIGRAKASAFAARHSVTSARRRPTEPERMKEKKT